MSSISKFYALCWQVCVVCAGEYVCDEFVALPILELLCFVIAFSYILSGAKGPIGPTTTAYPKLKNVLHVFDI